MALKSSQTEWNQTAETTLVRPSTAQPETKPCNNQNRDKPVTVTSVVRSVVSRMNGVFHVSDVKRQVWQIKPDANGLTVSTALHNMVHKYGELDSPFNQHYQRKTLAA